MNCEECNFYTEEFDIDINNNIPCCLKDKHFLTEDDCQNGCSNFNNELNCLDCQERYSKFYDWDDIDHYCKKLNCIIFQQQRSVLFKGDFRKKC